MDLSSCSAIVVGGHGFVGQHIVKAMKKRKMKVSTPRRIEDIAVEGANVLVWAAGYTADFAQNPAATIDAHAADYAKLLADKSFDAVLYLSSARLYDGCGLGLVDEASPLGWNPENHRHLFDLSKALGECLTHNYQEGRGHVLRLAGVYGDKLEGGSFLEDMVARAIEGWATDVDTAPDIARDYIHIEDVCAAVLAIIEKGRASSYIVASGETVENRTLLGLLSEHTGNQLTPVLSPAGVRTPTLDISRLRSLGVHPRPLSVGLNRVLTAQDNLRAMQSMMGVEQMPWM